MIIYLIAGLLSPLLTSFVTNSGRVTEASDREDDQTDLTPIQSQPYYQPSGRKESPYGEESPEEEAGQENQQAQELIRALRPAQYSHLGQSVRGGFLCYMRLWIYILAICLDIVVLAVLFSGYHRTGRFQAITPNTALDTTTGELCWSYDPIGGGGKIRTCKDIK